MPTQTQHPTKKKGSINSSSPQKLVSTCFDRESGTEPYYIDHTSDPEMDVLIKEAKNIRSANNVSETSRVFLCVAWASIEEIRLFKRFPEVVYCDATGDTNNTKNQSSECSFLYLVESTCTFFSSFLYLDRISSIFFG